jgi:hypothetical protein
VERPELELPTLQMIHRKALRSFAYTPLPGASLCFPHIGSSEQTLTPNGATSSARAYSEVAI